MSPRDPPAEWSASRLSPRYPRRRSGRTLACRESRIVLARTHVPSICHAATHFVLENFSSARLRARVCSCVCGCAARARARINACVPVCTRNRSCVRAAQLAQLFDHCRPVVVAFRHADTNARGASSSGPDRDAERPNLEQQVGDVEGRRDV